MEVIKVIFRFIKITFRFVWKKIMVKYALCFICVFALLIVYSNSIFPAINDILASIIASLIALPLIFIVHDLFHSVISLKSRKLVESKIKNDVNDIFVKFIYFSLYLRKPLVEMEGLIVPEIDSYLDDSKEEIFQQISKIEHQGFIIFSIFDSFDLEIERLLESNLSLKYLDEYEIALLLGFCKKCKALYDEFNFVSTNDFIMRERIKELSAKKSIMFESKVGNFIDIYSLAQDGVSKKHLCSQRFYSFEENVILSTYKISGNKAESIANCIKGVYDLIDKWKDYKNIKKVTSDECVVINCRIHPPNVLYFNQHFKQNISISFEWN